MATSTPDGGTPTSPLPPFRLAPVFSERVWGRPNLRPWYAETGTDQPVGEAWLTGPACRIETGPLAGRTLAAAVQDHSSEILNPTAAPEFPLLVKLLFPNDKLSVQVHPDDEQARAIGQPRGKTECWYVLEAAPGATVALGLKPGVTVEQLASSAADNTMESLIEQVPVSVGDMIYVDAGTIHAIGPGVVLLETQQTSDITYRLYDYGRPRELHLEQGLRVVRPQTSAGKIAPQQVDGFTRLIAQRYFTVDRFELPAGASVVLPASDSAGLSSCLIALSGSGNISTTAGSVELVPGKAVVLPASSTNPTLEATSPLVVVHCFEPRSI
ncbi:MAG TPA: type I phosphomannose isomerase catalytic subunit [Granulicella sp.]|jgi:mannose-6-phosphate isomerase|nr:type I phosphomannose isomerase catalytic subunit [Granulicella sp.]